MVIMGAADSAIWRRIMARALALAVAFAATAVASEDKPNKVERAAKKAGQAVENTAHRAGKWAERSATRAGKWVERTANKTDKAIRRALERKGSGPFFCVAARSSPEKGPDPFHFRFFRFIATISSCVVSGRC